MSSRISIAHDKGRSEPYLVFRLLLQPVNKEVVISTSSLPSPASTIESITREFEHSLDIRSATKGQYVVKPQVSVVVIEIRHSLTNSFYADKNYYSNYSALQQDEDKAKAEGPSSEELQRIAKLKAELLSKLPGLRANMATMSSNSIGRHSLGTHRIAGYAQGTRERRKSAGDQDLVKQLNMFVRTRTDSGKCLTDLVIFPSILPISTFLFSTFLFSI